MTFQSVMFSVGSLFLLALLALSAMGSPVEVRNSPVTLPMTRRLAFSNMSDLLRHDEARLAAFTEYSTHDRRTNFHAGLSSAELSTTHEWGYTVQVGIGDPFQTYNLIIDTTSAITWCGSDTPYSSHSGINIEVPVADNYGYGTFAGTLWEDRFIVDGHIIIPKMQFGVASSSQAIMADGVLGLAPTGTALVGLPNSPPITIPSVIDRLIEQGTISRPIVGILFKPIDENAATTHGQISFGGSDRYMYTNIEWTDMTTISPSSWYWGINQRITYANIEILPLTAGIMDSGCTFLYLASDAYEKYKDATGGTVNPANGLLQISLDQYNTLYNLDFHIDRSTYTFVPNAQIWPRFLNHKINGGDNDIFLVVKSLSTPTGAGCDFLNGYVFFQRFYVVLDGKKRRIGLSRTSFTISDSN